MGEVELKPEWQPIETAPKDGTVVDLFMTPEWAGEPYPESKFCVGPGMAVTIPAGHRVAGFRFIEAYWDKYVKCWRTKKDLHYINRPTYPVTHWMPVPSPPMEP
jgi:hypothetical protein